MKPPRARVVLVRSKNTDKTMDAFEVRLGAHVVNRYPFARNALTQRTTADHYAHHLAERLTEGLAGWFGEHAAAISVAELAAQLLPAVLHARAVMWGASPARAMAADTVPPWLEARQLAEEFVKGQETFDRIEAAETKDAEEAPAPEQEQKAS